MLFRNLGPERSSDLIRSAVQRTYAEWALRYGGLPSVPLRTEIDPRRTKSPNPGYCYKMAGFHSPRTVRGKVYLYAPEMETP